MDTKLYSELNKAWKSTCRVILGDEIGELKEYEDWLMEYYPNFSRKESHISGKEVILSSSGYCDSARFVSLSERDDPPSLDPLSINEIKDLDSILQAISEKWEYSGNKILGNSSNVEASDAMMDSHWIWGCFNSKKLQNSFGTVDVQGSDNIFGGGHMGYCDFMIAFFGGENNKRCFNSSTAADCSDMYFSHNCNGSHELMFCYGQLNKRNCIGNMGLPKERYKEIKNKLLEQIRDVLRKNKRVDYPFDLIKEKNNPDLSKLNIKLKDADTPHTDKSIINKEFSSTFRILLKKEPGTIGEYEGWLSKNVVTTVERRSVFGSKLYIPQNTNFKPFDVIPETRYATYEEGLELGKIRPQKEDMETLDKMLDWYSETWFYCIEYNGGKNNNIINSTILYNSSNIYKSYVAISSENSAMSAWPLHSRNVFGCRRTVHSKYSMKCFDSYNLTRCFEIDACDNCTDTYFSHNCEGLQETMFCFNTKGKRHAIGNTQLPPEQYRKIKDMLIEQIADEIIQTKELKYDIFNIGCAGKK